jgi:hypothetical protein
MNRTLSAMRRAIPGYWIASFLSGILETRRKQICPKRSRPECS